MDDDGTLIERFSGLGGIEGLKHGFVGRIGGVDTDGEKPEVMGRLRPRWMEMLEREGIGEADFWTAEQTHGDGVAIVRGGTGQEIPGVDGLVTEEAGVVLGIVVADCCAVFLVDPVQRVCGLVHAGRKGAEAGIAGKAIRVMGEAFGCDKQDLRVVLSACIRVPAFEVDVAGMVVESCLEAGVERWAIWDRGVCTFENVDRYYSYRREKGRTGRMLAYVGFD